MTQPSFATQHLDHLGIVAGICDRIDLIETIDTLSNSRPLWWRHQKMLYSRSITAECRINYNIELNFILVWTKYM